MAYRIKCLADRDSGQKSPEVVPVVQLRELSRPARSQKLWKALRRHILLVEGAATMGRQLRAGQPDQPLEVSIPEPLDIRTVAGLDPVKPECDCILLHHGRNPQQPRGSESVIPIQIAIAGGNGHDVEKEFMSDRTRI